MTTVAISVTARCTTAIAAIFMFPFVNNAYENHVIQVPLNVTVLLLPFVYFGTRIMLTDRFHQHNDGYQKAVEDGRDNDDVGRQNKIAECPIAIAGDSDEEANIADSDGQQPARDSCDGQEPVARNRSPND